MTMVIAIPAQAAEDRHEVPGDNQILGLTDMLGETWPADSRRPTGAEFPEYRGRHRAGDERVGQVTA